MVEKALAPHSSTRAWKIPWTEEPGRLWGLSRSWLCNWAQNLPYKFSMGYLAPTEMDFQFCPQLWHPTPVLLPGKSHGRRSLEGCSSWGRWGSDTTERLHFHFSLSCIGEGNGNPHQCSCLENPRDGGAWWAAVRGVAQSRTWLKRLSSSSSSSKGMSLIHIEKVYILSRATKNDTGLYAVKLVFISTTSKLKRKGP